MDIRPSHKELTNKIRQAAQAVSDDRVDIVDPPVIAMDAIELGYQIPDLLNVLSDMLSGLSPNNYIGYRPPEKSYEEKIKGSELFAFRARSKILSCDVYLKFALREEVMWVVSLHEFEEKGGNQP